MESWVGFVVGDGVVGAGVWLGIVVPGVGDAVGVAEGGKVEVGLGLVVTVGIGVGAAVGVAVGAGVGVTVATADTVIDGVGE